MYEVLVVIPGLTEVHGLLMTNFVMHYFRVICHYKYDPLWRPGFHFSFIDHHSMGIIQFDSVQILELQTIRHAIRIIHYVNFYFDLVLKTIWIY